MEFYKSTNLGRGRESEKQGREKRRSDTRERKDQDERLEDSMPSVAPIRYQRDRMTHLEDRAETFVSKPEQQLGRLMDELAKKKYDNIREALYSEAECYELLADAIVRGYNILAFLGCGFNRAAFLVESKDKKRLVVKIPIRREGFSDNRLEVYTYSEAIDLGIENTLARTEFDASDCFVIQEVCKPISWRSIKVEIQNALQDTADALHFEDIQAGVSLEDGLVKVYDFAGRDFPFSN